MPAHLATDPPERIVVTGATGNVGIALVERLLEDPAITSIVGLSRRPPRWTADRLAWRQLDLADDDAASGVLREALAGADAVVHLAWAFQPTHDPTLTWRANAVGTRLVAEAAAASGIRVFVHQSSVGAYSPGPSDGTPVTEDWPTDSLPTAGYGREKAYAERVVDALERGEPAMRVVRLRPAFIFQEAAASEQRKIFAGGLLPQRLVGSVGTPVLPWPGDLRFQALHAADAAEAIRLALTRPIRGAVNLAAEPIVGADEMAEVLGARRVVRLPVPVVRAAAATGWHARVLPAEPALLDLVLAAPLLDVTRARDELGWTPTHSALDALRALIDGWREDPPPLTPALADPGAEPTGFPSEPVG